MLASCKQKITKSDKYNTLALLHKKQHALHYPW